MESGQDNRYYIGVSSLKFKYLDYNISSFTINNYNTLINTISVLHYILMYNK